MGRKVSFKFWITEGAEKKALILKSVGKPQHPMGCIIIGDILVENIP